VTAVRVAGEALLRLREMADMVGVQVDVRLGRKRTRRMPLIPCSSQKHEAGVPDDLRRIVAVEQEHQQQHLDLQRKELRDRSAEGLECAGMAPAVRDGRTRMPKTPASPCAERREEKHEEHCWRWPSAGREAKASPAAAAVVVGVAVGRLSSSSWAQTKTRRKRSKRRKTSWTQRRRRRRRRRSGGGGDSNRRTRRRKRKGVPRREWWLLMPAAGHTRRQGRTPARRKKWRAAGVRCRCQG